MSWFLARRIDSDVRRPVLSWTMPLLSATTETVRKGSFGSFSHDVFVSAQRLTFTGRLCVTSEVVKPGHPLPMFCSLSIYSVYGNLCIAGSEFVIDTNLLAAFISQRISRQHHVCPATTASSRSASSAGSGSRHVKRLPTQVVCRVPIITSREDALWQTAVLVEHCKTTGLAGSGQLSFYFGNLLLKQNQRPVLLCC